MGIVEANRPHGFAHSVQGDHAVGNTGDTLQVVLGAGANSPKDHLFGRSTTQGHAHGIQKLFGGVEVLLLGQVLGITQSGYASGDDAHLDQWIGAVQEPSHNGMACLVVGHDFLLFGGDDFVFLFQATYNPIDGRIEVNHFDFFLVGACCDQGGFVAYIGDFGSRKSRGLFGQFVGIHFGGQFEGFEVDFEDLFSANKVRSVNADLTVESSRSKKGGVQYIRTVGGGHHDDAQVR